MPGPLVFDTFFRTVILSGAKNLWLPFTDSSRDAVSFSRKRVLRPIYCTVRPIVIGAAEIAPEVPITVIV